MQRSVLRLSICLALGPALAACGSEDSVAASASASDSDSADSSGTGVTITATDGMTEPTGAMSNSASQGSADSTSTGDSDSLGTDSASGETDSLGTDATDSMGTSTSDSDTASDDTGTTGDTGGPGDPPSDPPGVASGICEPPGLEQWCYSGAPPTYMIGICRPGVQECEQVDLDFGEWGECEDEQTPEVEVCDGLDNDCDGEVDEDLGSTNCGEGICNHDEPNCIDGEPNECDPDVGGTMETCNEIDDDCDGNIDDGLGDQVVECGLGQCEHEVTACEDGQPPECDPFEGASMEVCDGLDNDCDGETDEDIDDLHCGVGQCEHDVPGCINGIPQICDPFEGASDEQCDGIDNDCDGLTDEDQGNWVCGQFECQVSVPACVNGQPQGPESCVPLPGGDEICGDGIDNNCDNEAPACVETFLVGTDNQIRPIDIVWAVDSSGSMVSEMQTVEDNINAFATTLANSGSSARLHLVADRGTESLEICVAAPLGGANCGDNPEVFRQYDTNGNNNGSPMVHSSNALGRIMQQSGTWIPRLQPNSYLTFIVTTDDDGDDPSWVAPNDDSSTDDCGNGNIANNTTGNICRWDDPNSANNYTSLAYDLDANVLGFTSFVANFFPTRVVIDDWSFYSILGSTGTSVLTGADDVYEFACVDAAETGDEYVKLSLLTGTQDRMVNICDADWDLTGIADDIVNNVPNDTYILEGNPSGQCLLINPATIEVLVNGIPMAGADWAYDAPSCTLTILQNIPVVGDNVVIVYENF
jgi:hypothetical protein